MTKGTLRNFGQEKRPLAYIQFVFMKRIVFYLQGKLYVYNFDF